MTIFAGVGIRKKLKKAETAPTSWHQATIDDVAAAFRLLLRRPLDDGARQTWEDRLHKTITLEHLTFMILESPEFKRLTKPTVMTTDRDGGFVTMDDVLAAYQLFLRRLPEPEGLSHWQGQVKQGITLDRLSAIFMESDEFRRLTKPDIEIVELSGGYSVCVDKKDTDFAPGILYSRDYEPHVRKAITERLGMGQTFVDIGANIGCISFLAARLVGPTGRVISFEPNPNNLQRLYAGIVFNGFSNVRVMPHAVSDTPATFSLSGGTSNTVVMAARGVDTNSVYAQAVVPDRELAYLDRIDVIKIDIEGHEPHALRGCTELIRRHDPILFTEFAPRCLADVMGHDPIDYLRQVFDLYRRATIITPWGDFVEFDDAEAVMDHWRRRDAELTANDTLPDGMLHFDIIASNRH
jgi:FkbM family methyltransferase